MNVPTCPSPVPNGTARLAVDMVGVNHYPRRA